MSEEQSTNAIVGIGFGLLHAIMRKTTAVDVLGTCAEAVSPFGVGAVCAVEFRSIDGVHDGPARILGTWNHRADSSYDDMLLHTGPLRRVLAQLPSPLDAATLRQVAMNDDIRARFEYFMTGNELVDFLTFPIVQRGQVVGAIGLGFRDHTAVPTASLVMAVVAQPVFDALKEALRARTIERRPMQQPLTPREIECLQLCADGMSSWKIGRELAITERTATAHLANCMTKLNAETRMHAVAEGIRRGLIR